MTTAIISLITAVAVAIPTIWAWKLSRDKKKAEKQHAKTLENIRKSIHSGDESAVRQELAKWL